MVQTSKQMTQYDFEASSIAWWQFVLDLYLLSKYFYITLTCTIGSSVFDFKPGLTAGYRGRGSSTLWQDRRCWLDGTFHCWGKESEYYRYPNQGHSQDTTYI